MNKFHLCFEINLKTQVGMWKCSHSLQFICRQEFILKIIMDDYCSESEVSGVVIKV